MTCTFKVASETGQRGGQHLDGIAEGRPSDPEMLSHEFKGVGAAAGGPAGTPRAQVPASLAPEPRTAGLGTDPELRAPGRLGQSLDP